MTIHANPIASSQGPPDPKATFGRSWEAWNENKRCEHMTVDEIPVNDLSHLIYFFAFISPNDYEIETMPDVRSETFREISFLKNKNPDLKIQVALGGWTHNDPGKWQKVFSDMVARQSNRSKFIKNLLGFLAQYGYDGYVRCH